MYQMNEITQMYYSISFTRKIQTVFSYSFRTFYAYHLIRFSIYSYRSTATVPKVYPKRTLQFYLFNPAALHLNIFFQIIDNTLIPG